MTITLTREEAQQVLDALEDAADHIGCPDDDDAIGIARRILRARLAQPKREWQGLTAYEIQELHLENLHWGNFACAVAAKLKAKNAP